MPPAKLSFHEIWIEQQRLVSKAMDQAQPLLNTLDDAIAHAPTDQGCETLIAARTHLAATLNQEAAALGLGRIVI